MQDGLELDWVPSPVQQEPSAANTLTQLSPADQSLAHVSPPGVVFRSFTLIRTFSLFR
jgi:hypothetical protein